jgi:hypothetical protein
MGLLPRGGPLLRSLGASVGANVRRNSELARSTPSDPPSQRRQARSRFAVRPCAPQRVAGRSKAGGVSVAPRTGCAGVRRGKRSVGPTYRNPSLGAFCRHTQAHHRGNGANDTGVSPKRVPAAPRLNAESGRSASTETAVSCSWVRISGMTTRSCRRDFPHRARMTAALLAQRERLQKRFESRQPRYTKRVRT